MASRPPIPPLGLPDESVGNDTIEMLEKRLHAAEDDTRGLVEQLAAMGYAPENATFYSESGDKKPTIPPYKTWMADSEVMQQNYQMLVNRVCKSESALQTLKLTLTRVLAEKDLTSREKVRCKNAHAVF